MQTISAFEAKTHFLRILDDVERGETVVITRRGKPVATLSPRVESDLERARQAFARMRELRKGNPPVTIEEILSARDEGRR